MTWLYAFKDPSDCCLENKLQESERRREASQEAIAVRTLVRDDSVLGQVAALEVVRSKQGLVISEIEPTKLTVRLNNNKLKRGVKEDSKDFGLRKERMEMPPN